MLWWLSSSKSYLMLGYALVPDQKIHALMCVKFACSLAVGVTRLPLERAFLVLYPLFEKNFLPLPTMKSRASLDGILPVDKASGMTSHDVVAIVRRAFS